MEEEEQEEEGVFHPYVSERKSPVPVCTCLRSDESSEKPQISARKRRIYSTVPRTEAYLRERRIPELMRFLLTKILAEQSDNPVAYTEELLADCMLFRAGIGLAPVLYERRHLEAVVKSFDPGNCGSLTPGQIRKAFTTLGFYPVQPLEQNTPTAAVIEEMVKVQEKELYHLLTDGTADLRGKESTTVSATDSDSKQESAELKPIFSSI